MAKEVLNTTLDGDIKSNFNAYCKSIGVNMNLVLETFMKHFADGQFTFKLSKNNVELDIEE